LCPSRKLLIHSCKQNKRNKRLIRNHNFTVFSLSLVLEADSNDTLLPI
jgi:hypothetical protein